MTKTPTQLSTPFFGGSGLLGNNVLVRSEAGVTLLPGFASLIGSGSLEGKNPYAATGYTTGLAGSVIGGLGAIPGYGTIWPGQFHVYRWMLSHPTIAIARMTVIAPIVAGKWSYESTPEKAPKDAVDVIRNVFEKRRTRLLIDLLRAIDYGFAAFENVWGNEGGYRVPIKFKPLLPDMTTTLVDDHGNLKGIHNGVDLKFPYFTLWTYDGEGSNFYGRSRLENCRRTWQNWLADEDQLYRLENKASGILPEVGFPSDHKAPENPQDSNFERAKALAYSLSLGRPIVHENLAGLDVDALIQQPDLAGRSLYSIKLHDMGNTGPAQMALIESLRYKDALLTRGYLRPERMVIEASSAGSRADAESHATVSDADTDMLHSLLCACLNEQVVDPILEQNFGKEAVGTVRIRPRELVDENYIVDQKLVDAALRNQFTLAEIFKNIDVMAWAERNGIPLTKDAKINLPDAMDMSVSAYKQPIGGQPVGAANPNTPRGRGQPRKPTTTDKRPEPQKTVTPE